MDCQELDRQHHAAADGADGPDGAWARLASATALLLRDLVDVTATPEEAEPKVRAAADARELAAAMLALADTLAPDSKGVWGSAVALEAVLSELAETSAVAPGGEPAAVARHLATEIAVVVRGAQVAWSARHDGDEVARELLRGVLESERFASAMS